MKLIVSAVCLAFFIALGSGCKAESGQSAGYANDKAMTNDPSIPFHKVWRKPGFDLAKYKKVYIADVNTSYMIQHTDWQKGMRREDFEQDVQKLAAYTKDKLRKSFMEDPNHRFVVLNAPSRDPDALTFEFAITEVVPSKVVLNALGYAPFGIGLTITAVRFVAKDQSTVAFEARGRDGATGEVVFMAADREAQQTAIVDLRGMTWYSHAYGIIDDWAKQFVQIANRKPGETVEDTSAFRLKPW